MTITRNTLIWYAGIWVGFHYVKVIVFRIIPEFRLDHVAQSVMCLATDASLTTDPEVPSSILAQSHTHMEIDYEIISTVILLPSGHSPPFR